MSEDYKQNPNGGSSEERAPEKSSNTPRAQSEHGQQQGGQPETGHQDSGQEQRDFTEHRKARNARELLTDEIRRRAQKCNLRLRAQLTGSILVKIRNSPQRFLFDWTTEDLRIEETDFPNADCTISLSEDNLMRIANGELNPQIGILSEKIRLEGRPGLAIYFFNLIAPHSSPA